MRRLRETLAPKKKVKDVMDKLRNRGKERSDGKDREEETVDYTQDRSLPTEEVQEGEAWEQSTDSPVSGMDGGPGKRKIGKGMEAKRTLFDRKTPKSSTAQSQERRGRMSETKKKSAREGDALRKRLSRKKKASQHVDSCDEEVQEEQALDSQGSRPHR